MALLHLPSRHPRLVLQPERIQVSVWEQGLGWGLHTPALGLQPGRERAKVGGFGRTGGVGIPCFQEAAVGKGGIPLILSHLSHCLTQRSNLRQWDYLSRCLFEVERTGIASQNCKERAF